MRLINCLASPPFVLPVPAPHSPTPTEPADDDPIPSPQSTSLTLIDELADLCPAFHQGHTASYPTRVVPRDARLGPQPIVTALSLRTPARGLSSTGEIQRGCDFVPEVQIFEGGIVTVQGPNLIFSIIHFSPLSSDSPFTFTVSILFSTDDYWYMVQ